MQRPLAIPLPKPWFDSGLGFRLLGFLGFRIMLGFVRDGFRGTGHQSILTQHGDEMGKTADL